MILQNYIISHTTNYYYIPFLIRISKRQQSRFFDCDYHILGLADIKSEIEGSIGFRFLDE